MESSETTEAELARLVDKLERTLPATRKAQVRNELVGQLVSASIDNCSVYLKSLRGAQVASRTLFDVLTGGLSTAGSVTSPERSAKLLSALASFSNGAGASIDRDVFAEQGVELVAQEIKRVRDGMLTNIEQKKKTSYANWDLGAALAEVGTFHAECSMLRGLAHVQNAVTTRDNNLRTARQVAARVMAAGGTAEQVNAALAGVAEAETLAPPRRDSTEDDATSTPTLDDDVRDLQEKAQWCLAWAYDWLDDDGTRTVADLLKVSEFDAACVQQPDPLAKLFMASVAAKLNANTGLKKSADLKATIDKMAEDIRATNGRLAQQIVDRRDRTWRAATSMAETVTSGTAAKAEIAAVTGGAAAIPDPALAAAAAAANSVTATATNAPAVAGATKGALQGYLRSYTPLDLGWTPPPPPAPAAAEAD